MLRAEGPTPAHCIALPASSGQPAVLSHMRQLLDAEVGHQLAAERGAKAPAGATAPHAAESSAPQADAPGSPCSSELDYICEWIMVAAVMHAHLRLNGRLVLAWFLRAGVRSSC